MLVFRFIFLLISITSGHLMQAQISICTQADSLLAKNDYFLAIDLYQKCYEQDTTNMKVLANLASCYMFTGDYALAKPSYHKLEADSLYSFEAIGKLALIYESQQNLPKAIKYYISLNKIYPDHSVYLRKLANLYLQGRASNEAIQTYHKAYNLNSRDLITIQALAEIYLNMDEFAIADSIASNGIGIDSTNIGLLLMKSRIRYRMRDYSMAADILYKLVFETELNNYYNKILGYSLMQIDSLDKAIQFLQKSLINENDPEYSLYYLALAHEKKEEYEKAIWFYEEAAKAGISLNMAQYHRGLARIYTHQKAYSKVFTQYQKSLEFQPDPEVYFYLASAAEQMPKKKNNAITYYQKYIDSAHNNEEWIKHSKSRIKALKEYEFMNRK